MLEQLVAINNAIFFAVNNGLHSHIGDMLIGNATYLGNGWVTFPLTLLAVYLLEPKRIKLNLLLLAAIALGEAILVQIAKRLWDTPRPLSMFADAIRQHKVTVYVMFEPLNVHSFPSGHTQTAFCCAAFISMIALRTKGNEWPTKLFTVGLLLVAALVGISRMYVGAHFPIDVFIGMFLGTLPVIVVARLMEARERERSVQATPNEDPLDDVAVAPEPNLF